MGTADAETFPVALVLAGRKAVLLGAGPECVSKIPRLRDAQAEIVVVSEHVPENIASLADQGALTWIARHPAPSDAVGAAVCFVDTSLAALGAELATSARANGTLVCTLDRPEHATFVNLGVARSGPVALAVSTNGNAPSLSRAIREGLEHAIADGRLAAFTAAVGAARAAVSRGERGEVGRRLVEGFSVRLSLVFPEWFDGR